MTLWTTCGRFLAGAAALVMLSSCGATSDDEAEAVVPAASEQADPGPSETAEPSEDASPSASTEESTSATPTPTESPTTIPAAPVEPAVAPAPTPRQVWAAAYETNRTSYVAAVAAALALRPRNVDAAAGYRTSCRLLAKQRGLDQRVARAQRAFSSSRTSYDQTLLAIDATTATVCPELAPLHQAQTAERAERLRVEQEQARRAEEREAGQAREAERRAQREAQQQAAEEAEQTDVSYANCTEVEDAGAAPIYTGDPGYSSDLDRDGDGVACES